MLGLWETVLKVGMDWVGCVFKYALHQPLEHVPKGDSNYFFCFYPCRVLRMPHGCSWGGKGLRQCVQGWNSTCSSWRTMASNTVTPRSLWGVRMC
jgi:hypothetical protein